MADEIVLRVDDDGQVIKLEGGPGPSAALDRTLVIGEVTSNGLTGVDVSLAGIGGILAATDYIVSLSFNGTPAKNGFPYAERTTTKFTIKHAGSTPSIIGYEAKRKVA